MKRKAIAASIQKVATAITDSDAKAEVPQAPATTCIKRRHYLISEVILTDLPPHVYNSIIAKLFIKLPDYCPTELILWRSHKHQGLYLRVYGFTHVAGVVLTGPARLKGMIIQVKWKKNGNVLVPSKGFEGIAGTIDVAETELLLMRSIYHGSDTTPQEIKGTPA